MTKKPAAHAEPHAAATDTGAAAVSPARARALLKRGAERVSDVEVEKVVAKESKILALARKGPLRGAIDDVRTMTAMVRAHWDGSYRKVPWFSIASGVAALLYVLNPFDIVPDAIPLLGQLDDAAVIAACVKLVRKDLARFRDWLKTSKAPAKPDSSAK